jgi:mono/diheme cytochrome c family protein
VGGQLFKFQIAVFMPALSASLVVLFTRCAMLPAAAHDIEAGRKIAQRNCGRCHAVAEKGGSPFAMHRHSAI